MVEERGVDSRLPKGRGTLARSARFGVVRAVGGDSRPQPEVVGSAGSGRPPGAGEAGAPDSVEANSAALHGAVGRLRIW